MKDYFPIMLLLAASALCPGPVVAGEPAPLKVEIKELKQQATLVIRKSAKEGEIGAVLGAVFPKIGEFLGSKKINPLGPPFAKYLKHEGGVFEFEAGFPVPEGTKGEGDIVAGSLPAGKAAVVTHLGPYEQLSKTYELLQKWLQDNKKDSAGDLWEVYVSCPPGQVKPEEFRTDIFAPIK